MSHSEITDLSLSVASTPVEITNDLSLPPDASPLNHQRSAIQPTAPTTAGTADRGIVYNCKWVTASQPKILQDQHFTFGEGSLHGPLSNTT